MQASAASWEVTLEVQAFIDEAQLAVQPPRSEIGRTAGTVVGAVVGVSTSHLVLHASMLSMQVGIAFGIAAAQSCKANSQML